MAHQRTHLLAIGFGVLVDETLEVFVVTVDQPVTPALQVVESLVVLASRAVHLFEQGVDGIQVLYAHQLADERHVALTGAMSGVLAGFSQCFAQLVGQRQACQGIGLERGQALANSTSACCPGIGAACAWTRPGAPCWTFAISIARNRTSVGSHTPCSWPIAACCRRFLPMN
uniref:Uncharacterized protein n=1 Tax=Pseudomonas putida TaxID=303 RepID=Q9WWT6_PSEPU|nr:unknown [Pseudomonas putida]